MQFRRARRIMKSLRHEHILPLLAAGRLGSFAYLVMPYIQGGILKDRLEQDPLALEEAYAIFIYTFVTDVDDIDKYRIV